MRKIKTRTYNNFLLVMTEIENKGYTKEEAEEMTRRIFDEYEMNPAGLSVNARVERIIRAEKELDSMSGKENIHSSGIY